MGDSDINVITMSADVIDTPSDSDDLAKEMVEEVETKDTSDIDLVIRENGETQRDGCKSKSPDGDGEHKRTSSNTSGDIAGSRRTS